MNALEFAEKLRTYTHPTDAWLLCSEASEVVLRQHEAIQKLREALEQIHELPEGSRIAYKIARRFLQETKEFAQ